MIQVVTVLRRGVWRVDRFRLSLSGDEFCTGEMRRQELSGSIQCRGRFVEENLVRSGLDDQGRQAGQVGEYGADEAKSGVVSRRIVGDPGLECLRGEQRVGRAL